MYTSQGTIYAVAPNHLRRLTDDTDASHIWLPSPLKFISYCDLYSMDAFNFEQSHSRLGNVATERNVLREG